MERLEPQQYGSATGRFGSVLLLEPSLTGQVNRALRGAAGLLTLPGQNTEPFVAWRDNVNVAAFEAVTLKVVQQQLGKRMYHCHVLEHESQGMMGVLEVIV